MEGPSIRILVEEASGLRGKRVLRAEGSTRALDAESLNGLVLRDLKSWGKHLLLCFDSFTVRIHFLMFGSYRLNDRKETKPRLSLQFKTGELNVYSCSVALVTMPLAEMYDWRIDLMSEEWDEAHVARLVSGRRNELLCDLLLDQDVFAGSGNIIKNEVLFRQSLHPETPVQDLTARARRALIRDVREYCFLFYEWKKEFELKRNWQIYRKKSCPRCGTKVIMVKGCARDRINFYCPNCQRQGGQGSARG